MTPLTVFSLRCWALAALLLITSVADAAEEQAPEGSLSGSFGVLLSYGPVDGSVQTPAGGEPGSSSSGRPTLDELGIDRTTFYDVLAGLRWRRLPFYLGYQAIDLSGQAVLSQSLTTHNVTFPAGTSVSSDIQFNLLRVGAGWPFNLARGRLELSPIGELGVLDFSYDISGGGEMTSRAYSKGYLGFGLAGRYRINSRSQRDFQCASVPSDFQYPADHGAHRRVRIRSPVAKPPQPPLGISRRRCTADRVSRQPGAAE